MTKKMYQTMRELLVLAVAVAFCNVRMPEILAQDHAARFPMGHHMGAEVEESRIEPIQSRMRLHIDTMNRIAGLSVDAQRKLAVAATAAAERAFADAEKHVVNGKMGVSKQKDAARLGSVLSDEDSEASPEEKQGVTKFFAYEYRQVAIADVLKQPIWEKTVEKLLAPEQRTKLDTYWRERESNARAAALRNHMLELDRYLNFFPEQRAEIVQVIDEVLAQEKRQGNTVEIRRGSIWIKVGKREERFKLKLEDVQPVLSEAQLAEVLRWQKKR